MPRLQTSDGWAGAPERFNLVRDVVQSLPTGALAMRHLDRERRMTDVTAGEVLRETRGWAHVLRRAGIRAGDRVLVSLGKTRAWHPVMLGVLQVGAVAVPCSPMLRARDLEFRVRHSGAALLVGDDVARAEVASMSAALPTLYVDDTEPGEEDPEVADTRADEPAFILYTSGTTKDPKGVVQTHLYTWAKRAQAAAWLDARPGDLVWCTAGTGWAKSVWNVLLGPWSCGAAVVMDEGDFDPIERFELIERVRPDVLCQAPTEYRLMAKQGDLGRFSLRGLRTAVSGGEPLNPEVIAAFRDAFDLVVRDGYGQTENSLLIGNVAGAEVRPGSMGRAMPGHTMAVIDRDGQACPDGEEGDIALRGRPPTLFAGYWDAPEQTAAAFRGDWYVTGDRGVRDAEGYFWFTGRADDVILSAAYRIGPFEVESALLEHPAVAESAAVGKPDPDRGQIVKAFVVLRPGYVGDGDLVRELQAHAKSVTAPYKYPREIEFVTELPKTRSGKIRRVELRQLELARTTAPESR